MSCEEVAYAAIVVANGNSMYFHLMQAAKEVVSIGQSSASAYKRTMANFLHLMPFRTNPNSNDETSKLVGSPACVRRTQNRLRKGDDLQTRSSSIGRL